MVSLGTAAVVNRMLEVIDALDGNLSLQVDEVLSLLREDNVDPLIRAMPAVFRGRFLTWVQAHYTGDSSDLTVSIGSSSRSPASVMEGVRAVQKWMAAHYETARPQPESASVKAAPSRKYRHEVQLINFVFVGRDAGLGRLDPMSGQGYVLFMVRSFQEITAELNRLGAEGWRLVSCIHQPFEGGPHTGASVYACLQRTWVGRYAPGVLSPPLGGEVPEED